MQSMRAWYDALAVCVEIIAFGLALFEWAMRDLYGWSWWLLLILNALSLVIGYMATQVRQKWTKWRLPPEES
jgi:hypothetical protein